MPRSLADFAVSNTRGRINDAFREVLESVSVMQVCPGKDRLSLEGATIDDWWFVRIRGEGSIRLHGDLPAGAAESRAILRLMFSGNCYRQSEQPFFFGWPGELCLTRWENFGDVMF